LNPVVNLLFFSVLAVALLALAMVRRRARSGVRRGRSWNKRTVVEDALKFAWHEENDGRWATLHGLAGMLKLRDDAVIGLIDRMQSSGLVALSGERIELTETGNRHAVQIIRAHRMWERYLADETGVAPEHWHDDAERQEHTLSPGDVDALAARLGNPIYDPHGDPIPEADGSVHRREAVPVTALEVGRRGRVIHVEDEPPVVYAQLVAEGIYPGMLVAVDANSERRVILRTEGRKFALAPIVARNISVEVLVPGEESTAVDAATLVDLRRGEAGIVVHIAASCRGLMRRRIMDLGIVPGTRVVLERSAAGGGLCAYRVRGTTVALRDEQAREIAIRREEEPSARGNTTNGNSNNAPVPHAVSAMPTEERR